jgi:hypothetical protein
VEVARVVYFPSQRGRRAYQAVKLLSQKLSPCFDVHDINIKEEWSAIMLQL